MERILTAKEMKFNDEYTVKTLGFSEDVLVERAGIAVTEEILKRFKGGRVLVAVGKGNNGADGKVVAELLSKRHGFTVTTLNVYNGIFRLLEKDYDIIVDCIFGTGLNRVVEGKYKDAIEIINSKKAYVVSCDVPSGLNGTTGEVMGVCIKANLTVAIQELKTGYFLNSGYDYTGEVVKKDIGMSIWGDEYVKCLNDKDCFRFFEKRSRNTNKGSFGKASVIGGSKSFSGSVILSQNALASLKMGVGYSTVAVPNCVYQNVCGVNPECILTPLKDDGESIVFDKEQIDKLKMNDSIAIGMGMGATEQTYEIIKYLLLNYEGNLIIDADGLNALSRFGIEVLKEKKCRVLLTPHVKEFSRLTQEKTCVILSDIIAKSKEFAKDFNVVLLLKNATSIITDGEEVILNTTGCNGMAKCGSGDVLSGIIAGLSARGFDLFDSACVSAYLFGKAGEIAEKDYTEFCMTPSEVIKCLPKVVKKLMN
jgi:NAD(P)H-hydrate epimerase